MYVFPQDSGTGVPETSADYVDAGSLAQLVHAPNSTDFVIEGFNFTPSYSTPSVSVSTGVAKISATQTKTPDHSDDGGSDSKTVNRVEFAVQTSSSITVSLTDGATNEIYIDIDPSTKDYVDILAFSDGSTPSNPYLHIGTVDTTNNTATERNREPEVTARDISVPTGTVTVQGNEVLTTADDIQTDVENTDGTTLVPNVGAIQAGTDLAFTDDGDGTTTLDFTAEGSVDAGTLDGIDSTGFIQADGSISMSGNFDVAGNNVTGSAGNLDFSGDALEYATVGNGSGAFQVYDTAMGSTTLRVPENGPVSIPNTNLDISTNTLVASNGEVRGGGSGFGITATSGNLAIGTSGSGSDDVIVAGDTFTDIKNALATANNSGGTVLVPPGSYSWTERLVIRSDVELIAYGATFQREADIDAMLVNGSSSDSFSGYGGESNIAVKGGTWVANNGTYTSNVCLLAFGHGENITVKDATFSGVSTWHQIELNAVRDATVADCTFESFTATDKEMLQLDQMEGSSQFPWFGNYDNTACENIRVVGCTFRDGSTAIGTHTAAPNPHTTVRIRDCRFTNFDQRTIDMLDWTDVVVEGCDLNNTGAIRVMGGASGQTQFSIVDNSIDINTNLSGGPARAIHIDNFDGENTLSDVRISRNTVENPPNHAIGADNCDNVIVAENTIQNTSSSAIWIYGTDQAIVRDNEVKSTTGNVNIGGSGNGTNQVRVVENNIQTTLDIQSGSNTVIVANNILASLTNNGTSVQTHDNFVGGSWSA